MTVSPFSDTSSVSPKLQPPYDIANDLARRIGRKDLVGLRPGHWESLIFLSLMSIMDRLDAFEVREAEAREAEANGQSAAEPMEEF